MADWHLWVSLLDIRSVEQSVGSKVPRGYGDRRCKNEGWTPFEIRELLDGREGVREFTEGTLGSWSYVTAYRRLPDGDILGCDF